MIHWLTGLGITALSVICVLGGLKLLSMGLHRLFEIDN